MCLAILLASAVVIGSGGQPQLDAKECRLRLEGKWEAHLSAKQMLVMEVADDSVKLDSISNGRRTSGWGGKLVVSNDAPDKHFDWKKRVSANGPLADNQCLYRLVGNTLLVIGGGPNRRPAKFLSGHGNEPKTIIFTRRVEVGDRAIRR